MSIKREPIQPIGNPRPEVRVSEGKYIKYDFGQRPDSEVYGDSEFDVDITKNINIIASNEDYYIENYLNRVASSSSGDPALRSFGGKGFNMAYESLFGASNSIDRMYINYNRSNPIKKNSLITNASDDEYDTSMRFRSILRNNRRNNDSYEEDEEATHDKRPSFLERISNRSREMRSVDSEIGSGGKLLRRGASINKQANVGVIPGKLPNKQQFIKPFKKSVSENEEQIISQIREKRKQIASKFEAQKLQNRSNQNIIKSDFEEI